MRRREFVTLFGGVAAAWPLGARAQQAAMPVIGFLHPASASAWAPFVTAFRNGLKEAGYVEGQNVAIEYRWAENQIDRLPALAADLVRRQVAAIVSNTEGALAAKAATTTIPIVFTSGLDPVKLGLVASLNRPGGNITGVKWFSTEVVTKDLELLHELVPQAAVIGFLVNPKNRDASDQLKVMQEAARNLRIHLLVLNASTESEIDTGFTTLAQQRGTALVLGAGTFFTAQRQQIIALAARYAVATVSSQREFAAAGGLLSYSSSTVDSYRRVGGYAGRILQGEKPADLPVEQGTKFELVINLKTAKTIGLTISPNMLLIADEVIE
jgi:putative ABC transport system substrate-binding protein